MQIRKPNKETIAGLFWLMLVTWGCWRYGAGLQVDSANYFSVAASLVKGTGFTQFDGFPYLNAPPLYPLLLAPSVLLSLSPGYYALFLNLVFLGATLYYSFRILSVYLIGEERWMAFLLVSSVPFVYLQVFTQALSESGFIALLTCWFYFQVGGKQTSLSKNVTAFLLALMCLQRYLTFFLFPGIVIVWLLDKEKPREIVRQLWPSVLVSTLWQIRVFYVGGSFLGEHNLTTKFSVLAFGTTIRAIYNQFPDSAALLAGPVLLTALVAGGFFFGKKAFPESGRILIPSALFLILIFLQSNLQLNQLPRYVSVLWFPVMLVIAVNLVKWARQNRLKKSLIILLAMAQMLIVIKKLNAFSRTGSGGYSTDFWHGFHSEALKKIASEGDNLVSNFPDMVWWISGRPCHYSRFRYEAGSAYTKRVPQKYSLLWFTNAERNMVMLPLDSIHKKTGIQLIEADSGLIIYSVTQ